VTAISPSPKQWEFFDQQIISQSIRPYTNDRSVQDDGYICLPDLTLLIFEVLSYLVSKVEHYYYEFDSEMQDAVPLYVCF
jgi:hypothetical protein